MHKNQTPLLAPATSFLIKGETFLLSACVFPVFWRFKVCMSRNSINSTSGVKITITIVFSVSVVMEKKQVSGKGQYSTPRYANT